jgi:hypothetical protein
LVSSGVPTETTDVPDEWKEKMDEFQDAKKKKGKK